MHSKSGTQRVVMIGLLALAFIANNAYADEGVSDANETIRLFKKTDPDLARFFKSSVGYAVFPSVGKGGYVVGGAYGKGVLYQHGAPVGRTSLTQVTVGLQIGGQAYSEIIFFESERVLSDFKESNFAISGQLSAVAVTAGASATANYRSGVAIFTAAKGGLMAEASVGGQKFSYTPFKRR
jgi:lipid-binding SYLF domain-containing protein